MRYIAYIRKSTEQAERQSLSMPSQKRKILELFPGIRIVKWFEESKSAFKPGRNDFNEMMKLLSDNQADGIVTWHPDRLSRNEVDAAQITYGIRTGLIKDLKFGSYYFDNSPEGIMMLQGVMSHSQYYSSKLSKDVKRGNDEQRKRGWLTGRAIEGYLNYRTTDGLNQGIIVKDPERFSLRRRMWDLMLTGNYSVPEIASIANDEWGYATRGDKRNSKGSIGRSSLYSMFNNPRYAGRIPVPGQQDEYEDASYEKMVSVSEFERVQELLGKRGKQKNIEKRTFTYRGILICGECGCSITAEEKTKKLSNGITRSYIYYHCTHKRSCSQKMNIREDILEEQFGSILSKYTILPQFKAWALEVLDSQNEIETAEIDTILATQNRAIESGHKAVARLIKMASNELISEEQFIQEKSELEIKIVHLEEELLDTKKRADSWYGTFTRTFELAVHGRERFIHGSIETKKEILSNIGQNPIVINGELKITPYPWLKLIENDYKQLEDAYIKVRTESQQTQKASLEAVRSSWLGRWDSNDKR